MLWLYVDSLANCIGGTVNLLISLAKLVGVQMLFMANGCSETSANLWGY
jgi:hypothetical protein